MRLAGLPTSPPTHPLPTAPSLRSRWVAPAELRRLPAVPLLAETYERLHLTDSQAAAVQRLLDDRTHGAAELAGWAVDALQQEALALAAQGRAAGAAGGEGGGAAAMEHLRNLAYHLSVARPQMAAVANGVAAVLAAAHEELLARWAGAAGARAG